MLKSTPYFSMQHAHKSDCKGYIVKVEPTKNTTAAWDTIKIVNDNNGSVATELPEMLIR